MLRLRGAMFALSKIFSQLSQIGLDELLGAHLKQMKEEDISAKKWVIYGRNKGKF